ncbi:MAG: hypothetical protein LBT45_00340 [Rickettsiales bacterium]|jgi:hypothetical protein|nr:hypothetical protein [Rickettsiales bacterium]
MKNKPTGHEPEKAWISKDGFVLDEKLHFFNSICTNQSKGLENKQKRPFLRGLVKLGSAQLAISEPMKARIFKV